MSRQTYEREDGAVLGGAMLFFLIAWQIRREPNGKAPLGSTFIEWRIFPPWMLCHGAARLVVAVELFRYVAVSMPACSPKVKVLANVQFLASGPRRGTSK